MGGLFAVMIFVALIMALVVIWSVSGKNSDKKDIYGIIEAADNGDEVAKNRLYKMFENGLTAEKHNELRMRVYKPKAEQGDANAQYWVGFLYSCVIRDVKLAKYWYEKAAIQGDIRAMKAMAFGYSQYTNENPTDYGPVPFGYNLNEYLKWINMLIELGDASSMCELAREYEIGEIVEQNEEKAMELYRLAAEYNYGQGYCGLANIYGNIIGKHYDKKLKYKMLLKAMQCKERDAFEQASNSLGFMFGRAYLFDGKEDEFSDRRKAAYCFCLSYVLGNHTAEDNLRKLGYTISNNEFEQWKRDAFNLQYNSQFLEG